MKQYWTGYKTMTLVDLINRVSASIGSVGMAQSASYSKYNGHSVGMSFNERRQYWIAEYTWAGRQVISRGSFKDVLSQALLFQACNGASGSLVVYCKDESNEADCIAAGMTEHSMDIANKAYNELLPEWVHSEAVALVHLQKHMPVDFSKLIQAHKNGLTETQYNEMKAA